MVPRIIKQIVAILIAIAFVFSIFFFMPHSANNNLVAESILVPQALVSNVTSFQVSRGYSIIAQSGAASVYALTSSINGTTLLSLSEYLLKQLNMSYNISNGNLDCIFSRSFTMSLCDNINYSWALFENTNSSSNVTFPVSSSLSSIDLNSLLNPDNTFILVYRGSSGISNQNGSAPPPPPI